MRYSAGLLVVVLLLSAFPAMAGRITGTVSEVTDNNIVVKKGKQKLDIARDANTRVEGYLKKGARVTVEYTMTATGINVNEGKGRIMKKSK
jgi:hypothetical protein